LIGTRQHKKPKRQLSEILPAPQTAAPTEADEIKKYNEAQEELQVRLTAQRILAAHLRPDPDKETGDPTNAKYWAGDQTDLNRDLTGAMLVNFNLERCRIGDGLFRGARFDEETSFAGARFGGHAWFRGAWFGGDALFGGAWFGGDAWFDLARFGGYAWFGGAWFGGDAWFRGAWFDEDALFRGTRFGGDALFDDARFDEDASFDEARFGGDALFREVRFGERTHFVMVEFGGDAWFDEARFGGETSFDGVEFGGETSFDRARARWDASTLEYCTWPRGFGVRKPEPPDDGRIDGIEGVWGYLEYKPAAS
jgi:hypothetical protein